jgi:hypothetical protein
MRKAGESFRDCLMSDLGSDTAVQFIPVDADGKGGIGIRRGQASDGLWYLKI